MIMVPPFHSATARGGWCIGSPPGPPKPQGRELLFLSSLIYQTKLRLGTGVVNLGHRHPVVVAAEAAVFDQLSGARPMLGVEPGGLSRDAEQFGRPDQEQRFDVGQLRAPELPAGPMGGIRRLVGRRSRCAWSW